MYGLPDFTVGGALRQTVDIVKDRGRTLLALAMLFYAVPVAVMGALPRLGIGPNMAAVQASLAAGEAPTASSVTALMAYGWGVIIVSYVASLLASSAGIWAAHEGLHGRPAAIGGAAARSAGALLPATGMAILSLLGIMFASILLLVPGIMLLVRWTAALPAVVVERAGVRESLRRSRDLTSGHRWPVLGFLLLLLLFDAVIFVGARFGGSALAAAVGGGAGVTLAETLNFVANALTSTAGAAATAALYFELRRAAEGALSSETAAAFS